ncbi:MAG TPA: thaumatin family protein [Polyangiaceae bacterium]|nr:thaumatin family protein [Polyangiaceae bacterium]
MRTLKQAISLYCAGSIAVCVALLGCSGAAPSTAAAGGSAGSSAAATGGMATTCAKDGDGKTTLAFVNPCSNSVSFRGSDIAGGTLAPGASACVDIGSDVEALSAKRYWGFSGEDPGAERHTLAEFTFNTDFNDFDWYNISHVDAFNLSLQIVPLARPKCDVLTCAEDWLSVCPAVGQFKDPSGTTVACVSPERNNPDSPVARLFEACDDGYAWSGDDQKGSDPSPVRACAGEDWQIVFCPEAEP